MSEHVWPTMPAPDVEMIERDGARILRSRIALEPHDESLGAMFLDSAEAAGDRTWLADRADAGSPWTELSWADGRDRVMRLASGLRALGGGPKRPVVALSENSIEHAVVTMAGHLAGVPVCPVSVPYSLLSADHAKLSAILERVDPGVVFVQDAAAYERALATAARVSPGAVHLAVDGVDGGDGRLQSFADVMAGAEPIAEGVARDIGGDDVAKILFTSGSTGQPKGVINTHRMLCSNQQAMAQLWAFLADTPPVLCDWLPWSHTFGGNHNLNMVVRHGGSLFIDRGRPGPPPLLDLTIANLAEVQPTIWFNVPAGYAAAADRLEADPAVAARVFERLQVVFYAGAALPGETWQRLTAIAVEAVGRPVFLTSSWGATETAPAVACAHFPMERAGVVGVPLPGVEVKLAPGARSEARVKGPNVTPGYLGDPERTAEAFDDDGWYRMGDAMRLADPDDPSAGLVFDGRIAEEFKLSTGTWVTVSSLRVAVLDAARGLLADAVVTGADRDDVGLLVWPSPATLARHGGDPETLATDATFLDEVREALDRYAAAAAGSASRVRRVAVEVEPPSLDAGEITDKGYINQSAVLARRADRVAALHDDDAWAPDQLDLRG